MTITHKLTQHYAVTTPPRYLTAGNACKSRFIVIIPFPLTAPIVPLLGELWYFQYFLTWRPSAILNFKNFNI